MTKKKTFEEPVLFKHSERLDEITKFNDLGSHGVNSSTSAGGGRKGKQGKCPLGFK